MEREHRVRERAHAIWEREGRPEGHEREHWELAEAEIAREDGADGAPRGADMTQQAARGGAQQPGGGVGDDAGAAPPVSGQGLGADASPRSPEGPRAGPDSSPDPAGSRSADRQTAPEFRAGFERPRGPAQSAGQEPASAGGAGPGTSHLQPGGTAPEAGRAAGGVSVGTGARTAGKPTGSPTKPRR